MLQVPNMESTVAVLKSPYQAVQLLQLAPVTVVYIVAQARSASLTVTLQQQAAATASMPVALSPSRAKR